MFKELSLNVTFGEELISNRKVSTSGHLFVPSSSIKKLDIIMILLPNFDIKKANQIICQI
jgi:hypothetical protein